jgi:hypothetical protein
MPAQPHSINLLNLRSALLMEAIDLLLEELAALATRNWEKLPELKKKKVVAAARLRRMRAETEAADGAPADALESLVANLEAQSQHQMRVRLALIDHQLVALQDLSLYLRESMHVTLGRTANRPLGLGGAAG